MSAPGRGPATDSELLRVRREGVEGIIGRPAGRLRETPRDEGPGAAIGLDEHELPVAPVGGILLQDHLGGRPTPGEGVENQRVGAGSDPQYSPEEPHGFGYQRVQGGRVRVSHRLGLAGGADLGGVPDGGHLDRGGIGAPDFCVPGVGNYVGVGLEKERSGVFGASGLLPRYIGEEVFGPEELVHQDPRAVGLVVVEGHEEAAALGKEDAQ
jgi:hypothetical protein